MNAPRIQGAQTRMPAVLWILDGKRFLTLPVARFKWASAAQLAAWLTGQEPTATNRVSDLSRFAEKSWIASRHPTTSKIIVAIPQIVIW